MRKPKIEYPIRKAVWCSVKDEIINKIAIPYFSMKIKVDELGLWIRLKMTGDMFGIVFDKMIELYSKRGMTDPEAMKRAKENLDMFYLACSECSAENKAPISATIHTLESKAELTKQFLSFNENNHGKKLQENGSDS